VKVTRRLRPGTNIPDAPTDLVEKLNEQLGYVDKRAAE